MSDSKDESYHFMSGKISNVTVATRPISMEVDISVKEEVTADNTTTFETYKSTGYTDIATTLAATDVAGNYKFCNGIVTDSDSAKVTKKKNLTVLLLQCWQREYDQRPYRNFKFRAIDFYERMERSFHCTKDFRVIVKFLQENEKLLNVSIWGIEICNTDAILLKKFVMSLLWVRYIELKLMELPDEFFVLLRLNAHSLKVVELSLEASALTIENIRMLCSFLEINRTLRSLNVASCGITQYDFADLVDGVSKSSTVRAFNCSRLLGMHLVLDTQKVTCLISSLLFQNRLVELTMQQCEFLAQDVEAIVECLYREKFCLRKLNLAYNKMGPDGAKYLMLAIAANTNLEWLDISGNGIGTHGGEWVAQNLSKCKSLRHLYLNNNGIGADAINMILTSMKKPIMFQKLYVYGNTFNTKSATIVRRLLDSGVVSQDTLDITYTHAYGNNYLIIPWN